VSAKLESLIVDLQLQYAELRKGVDQANSKLDDFGHHVEGIAHKLEALGAFEIGKELIKGLAEFAMKGAEAADHMGKLAQSTGMPVEALSRLAYAAKLSHVSTEELGVGLNHLNKAMGAAAGGGKEQIALFSAMGVSIRDASGHLKTGDQVMADLADRFAEMKDGPAKAALAMELFGKSGATLIPLLNEGRDGLKEMADEADRLGITIDANTAQAAARFNDNLTRLKSATEAVATKVAGNLAPVLADITNRLLNSKEGADFLKGSVELLTGSLRVLVTAGVLVKGIFKAVGENLGAAAAAIVAMVSGDFAGVKDILADLGRDMKKEIKSDTDLVKAVWSDTAKSVETATERQAAAHKKAGDTIVTELARQKKALEENEAAQKRAAALVLEVDKMKGAGDVTNIGKLAELGNKNAARKTAYSSAGQQSWQAFDQKTAGFADFDDALKKLSESTRRALNLELEGKLLEKEGNIAAAAQMIELAAAAQKAADAADVAAGAFAEHHERQVKAKSGDHESAVAEINDKIKKAWADGDWAGTFAGVRDRIVESLGNLEQLGEAIKFGGNMLVSKLGQLGSVIQAGIQGAQAGGIWGALIAVILEMLSRFKRWQEIIDIGNGQLEQFLGDCKEGFGSLVDGLKQIMGGIGMIAKAVHGILNPIFKFIGQLLGKFSSVFAFIGQILEPIGTVLESLFNALSPILDILDMLSPILTVFGVIILSVLRAFFTVTNAITDLLDVLSFGIFHQWIQKLKINTDKLDQQISTLSEKGLSKLADESQSASANIGKMSNAAKDASRELTNMPSGFKVVLSEFYATQAHNSTGGSDAERNNFLTTGNPTQSGTAAGGPSHDSGSQGGSKGGTGGSHHGDA
jgi:hypothetical protein